MTNARNAMQDTSIEDVAPVEQIRFYFPALSRRINEVQVAYFDGPGGTQVPSDVGEAMIDYLYHHNANTHWSYPTSIETDEALDEARHTFADFLNADPTEIAFGANMTTLVMHVSRALGRQWQQGDEIIVTEMDHHANIDPWRELAREKNLTVKMVRVLTDEGQLDWDHFDSLISPRVKLIAIGAASNAIGAINPLEKAVKRAREIGALVFVDAVHYAPHELIDVKATDCDFLACSAYKFYGPHIGVLYGKLDLLEELDVPRLLPAPNRNAERLETGTQNHEGIVGAAAAVHFLANLCHDREASRRERLRRVFDVLHQRGNRLLTHMWDSLAACPGVTVFGPPPNARRTPTLSFTVDGMDAVDVTRRMAEEGVFASHGDFYATTLVQRLGQAENGMIRAGCACYTTHEEVDRLIRIVDESATG